jgi:trimeric autotransporter adhesin
MSTKTLRKRIALVAVAALGAGVLSVAPANADDNSAVGTGNATTAAGILNVATAPSITGDAVLAANGGGSGTLSLGLLANSTKQTTSSLTSTATMRADGEIAFFWTGSAIDKALTVVVDGGTVTGMTADGVEAININASRTQAVVAEDGTAVVANFSVSPNSGVTTMTVSAYESATIVAADDAAMIVAVAGIQSGATSKGSLVQRYTVTVATTSESGVYSASKSYVQAQVSGGIAAPTTNTDASNSTKIENASSSLGYISFDLRDAYGVSLSGKGALVVSATNGAGVALKNTTDGTYGANTSVTLLTAVSNFASGTVTVARPAAFLNKGFSTTVTISWNGAVVGTKSLTFLGEVATVTASSPKIGALGVANDTAFRLAFADSAGNALYPTEIDTSAVSSTLTTVVTGLRVATIGSSAGLADGELTCGADAGSADVQVQHLNPLSGTVVKSNVWKATCAGDAATYTASWDKASYTPGSIATLSILFKDEDGNLANDFTPVSTTANLITITGGPSATAVTIPADGDKSTNGVKTYQFVVGTTEGDFSAVVSAPVVNAEDGKNQTVGYKVANAVGAVSNADVLKAIVSLIASINKQIAALQKALLRR